MAGVEEALAMLERLSSTTTTIKPGRRVFVVEPGRVREAFERLADLLGSHGFYLSTIAGTDLKDEGKMRIDYYVVLLPSETTIVIRTLVERESPSVDSIADLVPGALAGELETYDMLGIAFRGNPHLRRGFLVPQDVAAKAFPLRKDAGV